MKRTLIATLFLSLLLATAPAWALKTYNITGLTGGTSRDLDYLSVDDLSDGDRAIGFVESGSSKYYYYFQYDATGTTAEQTSSHPYHVRPDDYSTGGVWVEASVSWMEFDSDLSLQNLAVNNTLTVNNVEASGQLSGSLPVTTLADNATTTISGVSREGGVCTNWQSTGGSGSTVHVGDGAKGDSFIASLDRSTRVATGSGNTIWVTFAATQTVLNDSLFTAGTSCYELSGTTGDVVTGICIADDVWQILTAGSPTETTQ